MKAKNNPSTCIWQSEDKTLAARVCKACSQMSGIRIRMRRSRRSDRRNPTHDTRKWDRLELQEAEQDLLLRAPHPGKPICRCRDSRLQIFALCPTPQWDPPAHPAIRDRRHIRTVSRISRHRGRGRNLRDNRTLPKRPHLSPMPVKEEEPSYCELCQYKHNLKYTVLFFSLRKRFQKNVAKQLT